MVVLVSGPGTTRVKFNFAEPWRKDVYEMLECDSSLGQHALGLGATSFFLQIVYGTYALELKEASLFT